MLKSFLLVCVCFALVLLSLLHASERIYVLSGTNDATEASAVITGVTSPADEVDFAGWSAVQEQWLRWRRPRSCQYASSGRPIRFMGIGVPKSASSWLWQSLRSRIALNHTRFKRACGEMFGEKECVAYNEPRLHLLFSTDVGIFNDTMRAFAAEAKMHGHRRRSLPSATEIGVRWMSKLSSALVSDVYLPSCEQRFARPREFVVVNGRRTCLTGDYFPITSMLPWMPSLVRHGLRAPQLRLVMLLRNPVDRLFSHYAHHERLRSFLGPRRLQRSLETSLALEIDALTQCGLVVTHVDVLRRLDYVVAYFCLQRVMISNGYLQLPSARSYGELERESPFYIFLGTYFFQLEYWRQALPYSSLLLSSNEVLTGPSHARRLSFVRNLAKHLCGNEQRLESALLSGGSTVGHQEIQPEVQQRDRDAVLSRSTQCFLFDYFAMHNEALRLVLSGDDRALVDDWQGNRPIFCPEK